jgi:hypothetical protein
MSPVSRSLRKKTEDEKCVKQIGLLTTSQNDEEI